jgi:YVTN family beta-propeller protein
MRQNSSVAGALTAPNTLAVLLVSSLMLLSTFGVLGYAPHLAQATPSASLGVPAIPEKRQLPQKTAGPSDLGSVVNTLDLLNNTVLPGNYAVPVCITPDFVYPMPSPSTKIFITCGTSGSVLVLNAQNQNLAASIPVGSNPWGMIFDPGNGNFYVTNEGSSSVSVISGTDYSLLQTLPVGSSPWQIALDSTTGDLYVTNGDSSNVSVISGSTNAVVGTINVGSNPWGVSYDSANGLVYVANSGSYNVSVINGTTNTVTNSISVGNAPVGITNDGSDIFVTNLNSNSVSVISGTTNTVVQTIAVGGSPWGASYDSVNGNLYVVDSATDNVSVINMTTYSAVGSIPVGISPQGVAFDAGTGVSTGLVYIANAGSSNLSVISPPESNKLLPTVTLGLQGTWGICNDEGNGDLYVTNSAAQTVNVINGSRNSIIATVPVGVAPQGLDYDSTNGNIYVGNVGVEDGTVSVISGSNNTRIETISTGWQTQSVTFDPVTGYLYATNWDSNTVSVIAGTNNTVVKTIKTLLKPMMMTYDPLNGDIYLGTNVANTLQVISGATNTMIQTIPAGNGPVGVLYDSGDGDIYEANTFGNNVMVFSGVNNSLLATITVGTSPMGIGYDPVNGNVYVANSGSDNLSVISGTQLLGSIPVGATPFFITYDPANGYAYVTDNGESALSILSLSPATSPLSSVIVTPSSEATYGNGSMVFTAIPNCTGGCPSGGSYSWSLNSTLGTLSSDTGQVVMFETGSSSGTATLTVTATLDGLTATGSAAIAVNPAIARVSVTPNAPNFVQGGAAVFLATVTCYPGVCPTSGFSYAWNLTNSSMGALSAVTGATATFTAGTNAGTVGIFVNATLNGITVESSTMITVSFIGPPITSVAVNPTIDVLQTGGTATFVATPSCGTSSCPWYMIYQWSLNNSLGSLSFENHSSSVFTAGTVPGMSLLTVTARLNGHTAVASAIISISSSQVPTLTSIAVTSSSTKVVSGGTLIFTAVPTCSGGNCLSGITYSWWTTNEMGELNTTQGSSVTFTAGNVTGNTTLLVSATLNGKTVQAVPLTITVGRSSSSANTGFLGLPGNLGYIVAGAAVVVVIGAVVALVMLRRGTRPSRSESDEPNSEKSDNESSKT